MPAESTVTSTPSSAARWVNTAAAAGDRQMFAEAHEADPHARQDGRGVVFRFTSRWTWRVHVATSK